MAKVLVATAAFDSERGGGGVRLAYQLSLQLVRDGHDVTVVTEALHAKEAEVETLQGIRVLTYSLPRFLLHSPNRHRLHISAVRRLLRKYVLTAPDLIHGHSLLQYYATISNFGSFTRKCYTIHSPFVPELRIVWGEQGLMGAIKKRLGLPLISRMERYCLHASDVLAAESEFTRGLIRDQYGDGVATRIVTIPGWVDLDRFKPLDADQKIVARKRLQWPIDLPVFFVLRRLEARMGLANLIRAAKLVKSKGYRFQIFIGGAGSHRGKLESLSISLCLQDTICFLGFMSNENVASAYACCDASIIPTSELECFGIIALEAMACGIPTLVTPVGSLPEIVERFERNWIAKESSDAGIGETMRAFLDHRLPDHDPHSIRRFVQDNFEFRSAYEKYKRLWFSPSC
jgi:glycosyltransferase involved in cell wall biosynthesis